MLQDRGKSASYRKSDVIFGIIMSEKPLVSKIDKIWEGVETAKVPNPTFRLLLNLTLNLRIYKGKRFLWYNHFCCKLRIVYITLHSYIAGIKGYYVDPLQSMLLSSTVSKKNSRRK